MTSTKSKNRKWDEYIYKRGDEKGILELNEIVFNEKKSLEYWNWQFKNNPSGEGIIRLAKDKEKIVGQYTIIPKKIMLNGKSILGAHSLDTMTHPDYERQGIFSTLAEHVYNDAEKLNVDLAFGYPNNLSYPVFIKRLGWNDVSDLTNLVKILNVVSAVSQMKKGKFKSALLKILLKIGNKTVLTTKKSPTINGLIIEKTKLFNKEYDKFWKKISKSFPIIVERTSKYLNWRYIDKPGNNYTILTARIDNEVAGFTVFDIKEKEGFRSGYIIDLITDPSNKDIAQTLINKSIEYFKDKNVDRISTWMPKEFIFYGLLRKNGFIERPFEYKFITKSISKKLSKDYIADKRNWFYTMGDSDIY